MINFKGINFNGARSNGPGSNGPGSRKPASNDDQAKAENQNAGDDLQGTGLKRLNVPRLSLPDDTPMLFLDGYEFISNRCRELQTDIFETRILLSKVTCMKGEEAARIFYDNDKFMRKGAMPKRGQKTLVGENSVQNLDDEAHRNRKQMHMSFMKPESIQQLTDIAADHWRAYALKWEKQPKVQLFRELNEILCRATCAWAGVPLYKSEVGKRTDDFMAEINSGATVGYQHWRGRFARKRTTQWLSDIIEAVRDQTLKVAPGSAVDVIAQHRDAQGNLLPSEVAADELNNIIRPTVAVSRYMIFEAHALQEHPEYRQKLKSGTDEDYSHFVQEVRRFYPFFPVAAAIVKNGFDWNGHHFPQGRWVLLDLYGTNRDPRSWELPDEFRPERFSTWDGSAFNLIPQGGGDHYENHRCAGEWITISLMKMALRMLVQEMEYEVPPQDLSISLAKIPALPASHFLISQVKLNPLDRAPTAQSKRVESLA